MTDEQRGVEVPELMEPVAGWDAERSACGAPDVRERCPPEGPSTQLVNNTPPGPKPNARTWAASASTTTWGSGIVLGRFDLSFTGPNTGTPPATLASCRSTVTVRRIQSMRSLVTARASP